MNQRAIIRILGPIIVLMLLAVHASAATLYVDASSANPTPPYTDWTTAATTIQDAVDAANDNDLILVTNGVYESGGQRGITFATNRLNITKAVSVQSVNGPVFSMISGDATMRCVFLTNGAVLSGFTITNGHAVSDLGGGIYCASTNAVITNCIVVGNTSANNGGGVYLGTLNNCVVMSNTVMNLFSSGGGVYNGHLNNCVVSGNSANSGSGANNSRIYNCTIVGNKSGVGVSGGTVANSIIYFNSPSDMSGVATPDHSCSPGLFSNGNITNAPAFLDAAGGNYHLTSGSPGINGGANGLAPFAIDLDGNARIVDGSVDIGAYENQSIGTVHYVNVSNQFAAYPYTTWFTAATTIQAAVTVAQPGETVLVTNGFYVSSNAVVTGVGTCRVALTNGINLQSVNGPQKTIISGADTINGIYVGSNSTLSGFTVAFGTGYGVSSVPGGTISSCVISSNQAGANGGTYLNCQITYNGRSTLLENGGVKNAALSNCVVAWNALRATAPAGGAGAYRSVLVNCILSNNIALYMTYGGGANQCILSNCVVTRNGITNTANDCTGGGTAFGTNYNCVITENLSSGLGGGTYQSTSYSCLISRNKSLGAGGGAYQSFSYNCLITENLATNNFGDSKGGGAYGGNLWNCTLAKNRAEGTGGGIYGGILSNCIVYFNSAPTGSNWNNAANSLQLYYCCTTPVYNFAIGIITNDPLFVDVNNGAFQLKYRSPCIDRGTSPSTPIPTDILGTSRPLDGNGDGVAAFDMGAYEFDLLSTVTTNWLTSHGLDPNDPLVFVHDPDGDGFTTLQEWIAGTDPTNSSSALAMASTAGNGSGIDVTWQSVAGILYQLERSTNLSAQPPFSILATNITGLAVTTTYSDSSATNGVPYFYRVGVP